MTRSRDAFLDAEYNPRTTIADATQIFERWRDQAADTRRRQAVVADLPYGAHPAQRLDLYPSAREPAPLLVFIHGGYWRAFDKSDFSWIAPPFVERGISVALINYGLIPAVDLFTLVRHNLDALAWLWREAPRYGIDRDRIVVSGHSAGGHLSAMMMAARWPVRDPGLPATLVRSGIALSGLFDLRPLARAPFLRDDLRLSEAQANDASPARMTAATDAPLFAAVGEFESSEFHRQMHLLAEAWGPRRVTQRVVEGTNHLTICDAFADPGSPLFAETLTRIAATAR